MKKLNVRYEWSWRYLSLWKNYDHAPIDCGDFTMTGGGSELVFTLYPSRLWSRFYYWFMFRLGLWPNPNIYWHLEAFEKRWKREHPPEFWAFAETDNEFSKILDRYVASTDAGELIRLNPRLLTPKPVTPCPGRSPD